MSLFQTTEYFQRESEVVMNATGPREPGLRRKHLGIGYHRQGRNPPPKTLGNAPVGNAWPEGDESFLLEDGNANLPIGSRDETRTFMSEIGRAHV